MALRSTPLPRDPDKLIEIVLNHESEIETLTATIATLRMLIFGPRSERSPSLIAQQIPLDLGDLICDLAPSAHDDLEDDKNKTARSTPLKKRKRNIGNLPIHLPRVDITIEPEAKACPCCAGNLHRIGEDVNEVLDRIPAILRVLRYIRPKYACRCCSVLSCRQRRVHA